MSVCVCVRAGIRACVRVCMHGSLTLGECRKVARPDFLGHRPTHPPARTHPPPALSQSLFRHSPSAPSFGTLSVPGHSHSAPGFGTLSVPGHSRSAPFSVLSQYRDALSAPLLPVALSQSHAAANPEPSPSSRKCSQMFSQRTRDDEAGLRLENREQLRA